VDLELSEEDVPGEEDWASASRANERVPIRSPQRIPTETNHHHLRPDPTTFIYSFIYSLRDDLPQIAVN
jgi:hypothetical protein